MKYLTEAPSEPICRSTDGARPCEFSDICHETRQRLQHYAKLRGTACWAFQQMSDHKLPPRDAA